MTKKFYITSAIAYPNSMPHLGHCLEIVQADALARFHKLLGKEVVFQTGTDEHGTKNWQTAKKQGKDIMEFLDANVAVFKELYKKLNINYDNFIRTTDKKMHYPGAIKLWEELVKSGDIYKKKYKGLYCTGCEAFKTEKELKNGKCPNHPTREIETVEEENYFFKLSKYKDEIINIIETDKYKVIPKTRKNEILSFLKTAKDISFSRPKSSLEWGIPVPGDDSHVMYVWCDALSNYITGAGYGREENKFNTIWPADIHVIGKDIIYFHYLFWPAILMGADFTLPDYLITHGFLTVNGEKMSKSRGTFLTAKQWLGVDSNPEHLRYFYASMISRKMADIDLDLEDYRSKVNNELVSNIANFCYRTLSFTANNFDRNFKNIEVDKKLFAQLKKKYTRIKDLYNDFNFKEVAREILEISHLCNSYFQGKEPWKLIKAGKNERKSAQEVLGTCINLVKNLAILLNPILPNFSEGLKDQLNLKKLDWDDIGFGLKNHTINTPTILLSKIEKELNLADVSKKFGYNTGRDNTGRDNTGRDNTGRDNAGGTDSSNEFPLNLKVAVIKEAENHPDADKLFVLQIELAGEKRQLVAGLREYYKAEDLVGKHIIIVSNLKSAKLRGKNSEGMLLAADKGKDVVVLEAPDSKSGAQVLVEGYSINQGQISYEEFSKLKLTVKGKKPVLKISDKKNIVLRIEDDKDIIADIKDGAKIR